MINIIKRLLKHKIIRYSIGGGSAALLDIALLYVFTDIFGMYYLVSACFSFVIAFTYGYIFQKYITFQDYSKKHIVQGGLFLLFQLIGQGIYMLLLRVGVDHMGIYYMYVAIFAKGMAFIRNYISNNHFNFKK